MSNFKAVTQFNEWAKVIEHLQPVDGKLYNLVVTSDLLVDIMINHNNMADSPEYTNNRDLRAAGVKKLLSQMKDGCWYDSISPIVFGSSGDIKDGQHRTEAKLKYSIENETSVYYSVVFANSYETKRASDSTGKQNASDEMRKAGAINPVTLNAVAKVWNHLEKGTDVRCTGGAPTDSWKISHMQVINKATAVVSSYLLDRPDIKLKAPFIRAVIAVTSVNISRGFKEFMMRDISDAVASYEDAETCCPNQVGDYFHYLEPLVRG